MEKIKVKLMGEGHSSGRGVGYYRQFLANSLKDSNKIELVSGSPDLVHYPFFDLFYSTLPMQKNYPTVVTIHDLTPLILTEFYPQGLRARLTLRRQTIAISSASAIITDSNNSRNDLTRLLKIPHDKIHVIPLAADPLYSDKIEPKDLSRVREKYMLPSRFILYVGGINANKNILRLAEVCVELKLKLVLVGSEFTKEPPQTLSFKKLLGLQKVHPELKEFQNLQKFIQLHTDDIKVLGYVPSRDLAAIYRLATVYCQPSLYEGFGLSLLEAMSSGCLVVSSQTGSLPEIFPHGAITFDPRDLSAIKTALSQALSLSISQKNNLIKTQKTKAAEYSWQKTADLTLAVYQSVMVG